MRSHIKRMDLGIWPLFTSRIILGVGVIKSDLFVLLKISIVCLTKTNKKYSVIFEGFEMH